MMFCLMYFWRFFSCHGMDQNAPYPWRFMRCVGCLAPSLSSFCLILILQYICERKTFLSKPKAICLEKVKIKCSICYPWIFGFDGGMHSQDFFSKRVCRFVLYLLDLWFLIYGWYLHISFVMSGYFVIIFNHLQLPLLGVWMCARHTFVDN